MPNRVRVLTVPDADRAELDRRARAKGAPARVVERARIVLLATDGLTGAQIAGRVLLTDLLTTDVDNPGSRWTRPRSTIPVSMPVRQLQTDLDSPDLATDQKVGDSSPSERAR